MEEGQFLEGYIADLIASTLAEAAAQYVHDHLKEIAEPWRGMKITNRYSPGYCGWKVDEQQKLFSLFPEGSCGITLSASSLMSPIKSLSGLLGAGPDVSFRDYTCELCSMKDCTFRKTRPYAHGMINSSGLTGAFMPKLNCLRWNPGLPTWRFQISPQVRDALRPHCAPPSDRFPGCKVPEVPDGSFPTCKPYGLPVFHQHGLLSALLVEFPIEKIMFGLLLPR